MRSSVAYTETEEQCEDKYGCRGRSPDGNHKSSKHQETAVAPLEQVSHKMVMVKASRSSFSKATPSELAIRWSICCKTMLRSSKLHGCADCCWYPK
jgi:hypothetical protein